MRKLNKINVRRLLVAVETVKDVLHSHENGVAGQREHQQLASVQTVQRLELLVHRRGLGFRRTLRVVERKEVLQRLVNLKLMSALLRLTSVSIERINPVASVDLHAVAVGIAFVENLADATVIVNEQSAVVNELNSALFQFSRGTLSTIIHDSDLSATRHTSHSNCRVHGVIVG